MTIQDTSTPVLVLCCEIGALGVFRSLGKLGIDVYGVDDSGNGIAVYSKYCKQHWVKLYKPEHAEKFVNFLLSIGKEICQKHQQEKAILIPTSDIFAELVSTFQQRLSQYFMFQCNKPELIERITSKKGMYGLAKEHNIPTPETLFPQNLEDLKSAASEITFPVMLKAIDGAKLFKRSRIKMLIINDLDELLEKYQKLEDFDEPNLMIQEYIPGDDDQVFIFNGYFNKDSQCKVAYTGHKIRQFPVHRGCASLGISTWIDDFSTLNQKLMKKIGYFGILDIGYRLDPRDGLYKVLDINPRLGGAFRLFVSENGMDVVRSLYLDFTGQKQSLSKPIEARKWMIENWDMISSYYYFREGSLGFIDWIRSFKGVQETAWFDIGDIKPFLFQIRKDIKKIIAHLIK